MQNFTPRSKLKRLIEGYLKEENLTYGKLGQTLGITGQAVGYVMRKQFPEEHLSMAKFMSIANTLQFTDEDLLSLFGR